jgi:protein TonB
MELKKDPRLDLRRRMPLFFNIGLVVSLLFVITAFEWKFYESGSGVDLTGPARFGDDMLVEVLEHKVIPPMPQVVHLVEVVDERELIDEPEIEIDIDYQEDRVLEDYVFEDPLDDEPADRTFILVEQMPTFRGQDQSAFLKYVMERVKYPKAARRMQLEGKVFVSFIIDKDGSVAEVKIVKGIGGGCDAEVMRVLNEAPKWQPGKQRGRPVKVSMMLPVTFRLN